MTTRKHLKQRIRNRMAKTGERYTSARAHILGELAADPMAASGASAHREVAPRANDGSGLPADGSVPGDWDFHGGVHADSAAFANVLANLGVVAPHTGRPLSEALVLGVGGGLGAGYILWEFAEHDARILVLGFRHSCQYPARWAQTTAERLGLHADLHETGGARAAATRLDRALERGLPAILWADHQRLGYRHLPDWLDGRGGPPVVAYGADGDSVLIDDRSSAPLSVPRATLADARARVGSYKHRLIEIDPALVEIDSQRLRAAVEDGIAAQVDHLRQASDSFSLPAWRKWARLTLDTRNKKSWPNVFADRRGLVSALVSIYENAGPPGPRAGNLRSLYAAFLEEAAALVDNPVLADVAPRFSAAAAAWEALIDTALPPEHRELGRLRALIDDTKDHVAAGDADADRVAAVAAERWERQTRLDRECPLDAVEVSELLAALHEHVTTIYELETKAIEALARAGGGG